MSARSFILLLVSVHAFVLHAEDLSRDTVYKSLEELGTAAKSFRPAHSKGEFQKLFSILEPGEMAVGAERPERIAESVQSCEAVWSGDGGALVFMTARPPTQATPAEIGLLMYVEKSAGGWKIMDVFRFTAVGKYARITAELTALAGSGYALNEEGFDPVVTIKEFQGGRGYSFDLSASYTIKGHTIVRRDLE